MKSSVKLLYQDKTCVDFSEIGDLLYSAESCLEKVLRKRVTDLHIHVLKAHFKAPIAKFLSLIEKRTLHQHLGKFHREEGVRILLEYKKKTCGSSGVL